MLTLGDKQDDTSSTYEARRLAIEKRLALLGREVSDWTMPELLAEVTERFAPSIIPPCRVCGAKLSLQASGGGHPDAWACSGIDAQGRYLHGRSCADDHYATSRHEDGRQGGDSAVMELVRRIEAIRLDGGG